MGRWTKCLFAVRETLLICLQTALNLEQECKRHSIVVTRQSFLGDPGDALASLLRNDARIIVGLFYEKEARKVFCKIYQMKALYGRRYQWLLIGWYSDTWFVPVAGEGLACTEEEMREAVEKHLTTEAQMLDIANIPGVSNMTGKQFQEKLIDLIDTPPGTTGGFVEAPLAYDAIWAVALALNCTMRSLAEDGNRKLEEFTYTDRYMLNVYMNCMRHAKFAGVSGSVRFTDAGDRVMTNKIEQMISWFAGDRCLIEWNDGEQAVQWYGSEAPSDSPKIVDRHMVTTLSVYIGLMVVIVFSLSCATGALIFNYENQRRKYMEQSQPQCNAVIIAGCGLSLISVLLWGLPADGLLVHEQRFTLLCHSRIVLMVWGFTFSYGMLFAKVWMVRRYGSAEYHDARRRRTANRTVDTAAQEEEDEVSERLAERIRKMTMNMFIGPFAGRPAAPVLQQKCNKLISSLKFNIIVGTMFFVDTLIMGAWMEFDPLIRIEQVFPLVDMPDEDRVERPVLHTCHSKHEQVWSGVLLAYKGLTLVIGVFVALESRTLRQRYVNDSRMIQLAIYNVAALALLTTPVVLFLIDAKNTDARFVFVALTVISCSLVTLGLVFVPKIIYIYRNPRAGGTQNVANRTPGVTRKKVHKKHKMSFRRAVQAATVTATTSVDQPSTSGVNLATPSTTSEHKMSISVDDPPTMTTTIRKWTVATVATAQAAFYHSAGKPTETTTTTNNNNVPRPLTERRKSVAKLRYEQVVANNDQMRKLLAQKEARVGELRRRLVARQRQAREQSNNEDNVVVVHAANDQVDDDYVMLASDTML